MKSLFDLFPKDTNSKEYKIVQTLFAWAFHNTSFDNSINLEGILVNEIERQQLPKDDKQALVLWFLLFPVMDAVDYVDLIIDKLKFPITLVFYVNAIAGRLSVLKQIMRYQTDAADQLLLQAEAQPFIYKLGYLHIKTLKWFKLKDSDFVARLVRLNNSIFFFEACQNGEIETLEWLEKILSNEVLNQLIERTNFAVFSSVAFDGSIAVVQWLLKKPHCFAHVEQHSEIYGERCVKPFVQATLVQLHKESQQSSSQAYDITDPNRIRMCFYILRYVIRSNDRSLDKELQFMLSIPKVRASVGQRQNTSKSNELLRLALTDGNIEAVKQLIQIQEVKLLAEQNAFYIADARVGPNYLKVLIWIKQEYPKILDVTYLERLVTQAVQIGHFETLEWLDIHAHEALQKSIELQYREILIQACSKGSVKLLDFLKSRLSEGELNKALVANGTQLVNLAAQSGCLEVLSWLKEQLKEVFFQKSSYLFELVAKHGHVPVLQWYKDSLSSVLFENLMTNKGYDAFVWANTKNQVAVLDWFKSLGAERVEEWIKKDQYSVLKRALSNGNSTTISWHLQYWQIFVFAEKEAFGDQIGFIRVFMVNQLSLLAEERNDYLHTREVLQAEPVNDKKKVRFDPNAFKPFDIKNSNTVQLCFNMVRAIVRMNDEFLNKKLPFLLAIPAVRALLGEKVLIELKDLACIKGNTLARKYLMPLLLEEQAALLNKQEDASGSQVPPDAFFQTVPINNSTSSDATEEFKY